MQVTLVRPPTITSARTYSAPVTLPLGLAILAAVLERDGFSVEAVDGLAMDMDRWTTSDCGRFAYQGASFAEVVAAVPENTAMLGISVMFSQEWPHARRLMERLRDRFPGVPIVAGGEHITALPEYSLRDGRAFDIAVLGEGEGTLIALAEALRDGRSWDDVPGLAWLEGESYRQTPRAARLKDVDALPWPAWHLFDVEAYFRPHFTMGISKGRNLVALATRGCPYRCTFCSSPTMWTTRYVMRSPADVADEIAHGVEVYGATSIDFLDLTAIVKRSWILAFTEELKRRRLTVTWQLPSGTRSEALDAEVLRALKEAGCGYLVYAPESGSERVLRAIDKRIKLPRMVESMRQAKAEGLVVKANFVIGFPEETREDIWKTLRLMMDLARAGVDDADLALFTPYPGSPLFEELHGTGELGTLGDSYFENLIVLYDFTFVRSFCRHVPALELLVYRVVGLSLFYALAYGSHPGRIVDLLRRLGPRFEAANLFEQRLSDAWARIGMQQ